MRLFWLILLSNGAIVLAATVISVLLYSRGTVDSPVSPPELLVLGIALAALVLLSFFLTRRVLAPLERLVSTLRTIDPLTPGQRVTASPGALEARELAAAFDDMLVRLQTEREASARRALDAQEGERLRVAQELHDEIGQNLTAALLHLGRVRKQAPPEMQAELAEVAETVRENLDELRRIAHRLRPQELDELGLTSALATFATRLSEQTGLPIERHIERDIPDLNREQELVVYRVAQEALTNVVRHAGASSAGLALSGSPGVRLEVTDDGRGIDGRRPGAGIEGMRERAAVIHAELDIGPGADGGTRVVLQLGGNGDGPGA
jgi:two-component system, NarL family, sensor histidine kinase UhpB